jgi:uncharacterized protein YbjT (DUF2867 family)
MSTRTILIAGATGKQGGAVLKALLASQPNPPFSVLALTRNPSSPSAQRLASQPLVSLLQGDLSDPPALFSKIKTPLYGAFLVTNLGVGPFARKDTEETQGKAFVDAALTHGVKRFVFSSVDRGGPKISDENETDVPHFASKARIEKHLISKIAAQKGEKTRYTILRTVAFYENLTPNFLGRAFATFWQKQGSTPLYFISTTDIGVFAANAFTKPHEYEDKTISIGSQAMTFEQGSKIFKEVVGIDVPMTFGFVGAMIKWLVADLGKMFDRLKKTPCVIDEVDMKDRNPSMMDFRTWLKTQSGFRKS